jgi:hypothetical protein
MQKKHIFSEFEIRKQKISAETRDMSSVYIATQSKPRRSLEEECDGKISEIETGN